MHTSGRNAVMKQIEAKMIFFFLICIIFLIIQQLGVNYSLHTHIETESMQYMSQNATKLDRSNFNQQCCVYSNGVA